MCQKVFVRIKIPPAPIGVKITLAKTLPANDLAEQRPFRNTVFVAAGVSAGLGLKKQWIHMSHAAQKSRTPSHSGQTKPLIWPAGTPAATVEILRLTYFNAHGVSEDFFSGHAD